GCGRRSLFLVQKQRSDLTPVVIPFAFADETKEPEMPDLQALPALLEQGMRESNSHQRFWRPLSYHLTNPLYKRIPLWNTFSLYANEVFLSSGDGGICPAT